MPNNGKKTGKRKSSPKKKSSKVSPSSNSLVYKGPYHLPGSSEQNTLYTLETKSVISLASSVSGVIDAVYDNNPSGYQDWSSIAALWDEYRPLSLKIVFKPNNRYSKTTTVTVPIYVVADRDSVGALASKNAAIQYESCQIKSLDDPFTKGIKAVGLSGLTTHQWLTTASPSATFCIKTFATGCSNSTTYGDVIITALIQVRGRN